MKVPRNSITLSIIHLSFWILSSLCYSENMPQDNWVVVKKVVSKTGSGPGQFGNSIPTGIAVGTNGNVYVTDPGNSRIQTFSHDGEYLFSWGTNGSGDGQFSYPSSITISESNTVYVLDLQDRRIQAFDASGNFLFKWGSFGAGDGEFFGASGITSSSNRIFVVDGQTSEIQVFDHAGNFIRRWGSFGSFDGELNQAHDAAVAPNGSIHIVEIDGGRRIQVFDKNGNFIRKYDGTFTSEGIYIGQDGSTYVCYKSNSIGVFDPQGNLVRLISQSDFLQYEFDIDFYDAAASKDGRLFAGIRDKDLNGNGFIILDRGYRTMTSPSPTSALPLPYIQITKQRPGTALVDVDYQITDADTDLLTTAALGFLNGQSSLSSIVTLDTLVEGTATNVGANISADTVHRLTWDASADLSTNFVSFEAAILASDGRDLLDFHFITVPSNAPNPELTMNRSPVTQTDLLNVWYWLIATNDAAIHLSTGSVVGVGGAYNGQLLAQGTNTTEAGRDFIFDRLNVRAATAQEVLYAKEGSTSGTVNQFEPRNRIGDRPKKINEWGFDTGTYATNDWWAVPLP